MSRGAGKWQRFWFDLATNRIEDFDASEPWTFSKVCDALWPDDRSYGTVRHILHAGTKRAMRRALQGIVNIRFVIAIRGPSNPQRAYIVNPHILKEDDPLRLKILAAFAAEGLGISPSGHFTQLSAHTEHLGRS
jgi:hypothetical protein